MFNRAMPLNGNSQIFHILAGSGWVTAWHADQAGKYGEPLQNQFVALLKNRGGTHSAKWMREMCFPER